MTRTTTKTVVSANGSAVESATGSCSPSVDRVFVGALDATSDVSGSPLVLYSITVYLPQDDAALPALSAP